MKLLPQKASKKCRKVRLKMQYLVDIQDELCYDKIAYSYSHLKHSKEEF